MMTKKSILAFTSIATLASFLNLSTKIHVDSTASNPTTKHLNCLEDSLTENSRATIIIDPGHDSTHIGHHENKFREENLNLLLSKKLDTLLSKNNYKVLLVRQSFSQINTDSLDLNNDNSINVQDELLARAEYIHNNKSDCAIVIHYNAYLASSKVNGAEIYFYGLQNKQQNKDKHLNFNFPKDCRIYSRSSREVAYKLAEYLRVHGKKATIYGSDMKELTENPAKTVIYFEAGYLTNPSDLKKATTKEGQNETAKILADFFRENTDYIKSFRQDSSNIVANR